MNLFTNEERLLYVDLRINQNRAKQIKKTEQSYVPQLTSGSDYA